MFQAGLPPLAAPDIDGNKQEQPDNVNEMPVPGRSFKAEMLLGGEMPLQATPRADSKEQCPDNHMKAVEACCHEEDRRIDPVGKAERCMAVFNTLKDSKECPKCDCDRQTDEIAAVILNQRMVGMSLNSQTEAGSAY